MKPISKIEYQIVQVAQLIYNDYVYIVGTGLPLLAGALGKRCYAPKACLILESGLIDAAPKEVPSSVTDLRLMCTSSVLWDSYRYMGYQTNSWLRDNKKLMAFIGGAQIDPYGNVNSTLIGDDHQKPQVRFSGSGGANGIATYANTIILMKHNRQRFVEKVDYITSPGYIDGPGGRKKKGLPDNRGPQYVVTELGIMAFDETSKRMYLKGYFPYSSPEEVQDNTGFKIDVSRAKPLPKPDSRVIKILREEIDPQGVFIDK